jgi:hypothetical protein
LELIDPIYSMEKVMKHLGHGIVVTLSGISLFGCVWPQPVPLAPGADQVRITRNAADVASCAAVGNIDSRMTGIPTQIPPQMQNQAVGLGGNVVLDTSVVGTTTTGVIYRCERTNSSM